MLNIAALLYLMAFPLGFVGLVQLVFAWLSVSVFDDAIAWSFVFPGSLCMALSLVMLLVFQKRFDADRIGFRDSLLFTVATWMVAGVSTSIPILLVTHISFTDSVFEALSGLTTTGATMLDHLDALPKSFLMYRQFLQWMGGLGVVIFVVAILPMLNFGGMRLLKSEMAGPVKDDKLAPRIIKTAQYLWMVYLVLTGLCALGYYLAGMTAYDALAHSFTTVSTGGFSTHDASMGYYHTPVMFAVSDCFMLLGAISFALHFKIYQQRNLWLYFKDEETRSFLLVILVLSIVVSLMLMKEHQYDSWLTAFSDGAFILISFITSTGFGAADYVAWPPAIIFLIVFAAYLGGCAGSTAGGNKIIRGVLLARIIWREMKRLVHPHGVFQVKFNQTPVAPTVLSGTVTFIMLVIFSTAALTVALMMTGLSLEASFTAVAACLNVLGPAFAELGSNFQPVNDAGTWLLSGAMILGRLEYFTVLALFLPAYWRY